jgi:hypothetical protein
MATLTTHTLNSVDGTHAGQVGSHPTVHACLFLRPLPTPAAG